MAGSEVVESVIILRRRPAACGTGRRREFWLGAEPTASAPRGPLQGARILVCPLPHCKERSLLLTMLTHA